MHQVDYALRLACPIADIGLLLRSTSGIPCNAPQSSQRGYTTFHPGQARCMSTFVSQAPCSEQILIMKLIWRVTIQNLIDLDMTACYCAGSAERNSSNILAYTSYGEYRIPLAWCSSARQMKLPSASKLPSSGQQELCLAFEAMRGYMILHAGHNTSTATHDVTSIDDKAEHGLATEKVEVKWGPMTYHLGYTGSLGYKTFGLVQTLQTARHQWQCIYAQCFCDPCSWASHKLGHLFALCRNLKDIFAGFWDGTFFANPICTCNWLCMTIDSACWQGQQKDRTLQLLSDKREEIQNCKLTLNELISSNRWRQACLHLIMNKRVCL